MSEDRYYRGDVLMCGECGSALLLCNREAGTKMLVHSLSKCSKSGRVYYAPHVDLTEIPEEFAKRPV